MREGQAAGVMIWRLDADGVAVVEARIVAPRWRGGLVNLALLEAGLLGKGDSETEAVTLRTALAERSMPPRHALDLLTAFRMDVTKLRYENWDEVIHYCRYSAMPVGRFVLDVHGESTSTWAASPATRPGFRAPIWPTW